MQLRFLFFTLLFGFFVLITHAQNTSPYWSLAGNSNATATSKLGTTTSLPLNLVTSNLTRLRIDPNGRIGVGFATTPFSTFQVKGNGSFGNRVSSLNATRALNLVDTAAVMRILRVHSTFAPAVELISRQTADGPNVAYWDMYAEPTDSSFRIRDRGTGGSGFTRFFISHTTANVGIGTLTPQARLEVRRGNGGGLISKFTNGSTSGDRSALVEMQNGDGVLWKYGVGGTGNLYDLPSNGEFYISQGNFRPLLVIDQKGQVNVGTQRFGSQRLSVFGEIRTTSWEDPITGIGGTGIKSDGEYVGLWADGAEVAGVTATTINGNAIEGYLTGEDQGGYAGYFGGEIYYTGSFQGSDRKLKQNIADFSSALNIINKLQPKAYEYRHDGDYKWMHLPKGKHFGLIAQDVEEVLPDLIKNSKFDVGRAKSFGNFKRDSQQTRSAKPTSEKMEFKAVNYTELIPIMVKAIQEQDIENKELKSQIGELEARLQKLETLLTQNHSNNFTINISSAYLEQNTPNPSRGTTTIRYGIPDGTTTARLTLTNSKGQTLKEVNLTGRGISQLNLNTAALPSGTYTYTLWVNGQQAASKQLVIAR